MTVAYELGPKAYTRLIRIKITRVLRAPNKLKCRLSCTHHQSMQLLTLIFLSLASVPPPKYAPPPTPPGAAAHCARRALASLWLVLAPCLRCPHPIPTVGAPIPEVVSKWFPRDCLRWVCVFARGFILLQRRLCMQPPCFALCSACVLRRCGLAARVHVVGAQARRLVLAVT